ncbi:hypothetical protein JOC48_002149 [Aquibacillus albus]|uniref:Uncharacterized protein n=1 Tax=Aquibacillus albus TaxID=1168171 RepID=A0ABS2N167_9BACI|nr:hypothetical protein [Aquibacillus albus]
MVQETLTSATWGWLLIPMLSVVVLSLITFFTGRGE